MNVYHLKRDDRILVGISWSRPKDGVSTVDARGQKRGWYRGDEMDDMRYFVAATIKAIDLNAGIIIYEADTPHAGGHCWDELHFREYDDESQVIIKPRTDADWARYPMDTASAEAMFDAGVHPDYVNA